MSGKNKMRNTFVPKRRVERKGSRNNSRLNPPDSLVSYKGPLRLPPIKQDSITVELIQYYGTPNPTATLASDAHFVANPSTAQDWSEWANIYGEYRTLALSAEWCPYNTGPIGTTTTLTSPFYVLWDHNAATANTALTTIASAMEPQMMCFPTTQQFVYSTKMQGVDEANFVSTAAPTNVYGIKTLVTNSASFTLLGDFIIRRVVQFKSRI